MECVCILVCIGCLMFIVNLHAGADSDNIAIGLHTFQSSTEWGGESSSAVDGDRNTEFFNGSCSHTQNDDNPWWAVDLQHNHLVGEVHVTNREHATSVKLSMIRIGTTDESPELVAPTVHSITVCACQDSPIGNGETKVFNCGVTGRYLVVLLEKTESLVMCEVEIFEGVPDTPNPIVPFGFRPSANNHLNKCFFDSLTAQQQHDMFHCFTQCLHSPCCQAVNITSCEQSYVKTEEIDFVKTHVN